jgi:hypothetical protein
MKHNVCVNPLRRVRLELAKLPHHTMWQMKLDCPHTYHWTPRMPKMPFRSTHRVQMEFGCKTETITRTVRLPYHLKVNTMYSYLVQENEHNVTTIGTCSGVRVSNSLMYRFYKSSTSLFTSGTTSHLKAQVG